MKNREYENLVEVNLGSLKIRVWVTQPSLEAAAATNLHDLQLRINAAVRGCLTCFAAMAEAIEREIPAASAIAITLPDGCGITLYPDWK